MHGCICAGMYGCMGAWMFGVLFASLSVSIHMWSMWCCTWYAAHGVHTPCLSLSDVLVVVRHPLFRELGTADTDAMQAAEQIGAATPKSQTGTRDLASHRRTFERCHCRGDCQSLLSPLVPGSFRYFLLGPLWIEEPFKGLLMEPFKTYLSYPVVFCLARSGNSNERPFTQPCAQLMSCARATSVYAGVFAIAFLVESIATWSAPSVRVGRSPSAQAICTTVCMRMNLSSGP